MPESPFVKWVSDPLYGSIPLTQVEVDVIDTQVFQRLRRIGQLGLVNLVFPSATYTRFTHSLGACHVIGEILEKLERDWRSEGELAGQWQEHRLAMLLHDVGHYFMSHATEHAAEPYYRDLPAFIEGDTVDLKKKEPPVFLDHEQVGSLVLHNDDELRTVLARNNQDPESIAQIFTRERKTLFTSLVSSDLDADRIDYLMRSAQATGLPYGFHDRDFILRNLVVCPNPELDEGEPEELVCIKEKAVRSADHFLLSRMFDYMQVIYQPAVVGFEYMLQHAIQGLLRIGRLALDKATVIASIQDGTWHGWDDEFLLRLIKDNMLNAELKNTERCSIRRLVSRKPPPILYSYESINRKLDAGQGDLHSAAFKAGVGRSQLLSDNCLCWRVSFKLMSTPTHSLSSHKSEDKKDRKVIRVKCDDEIKRIIEVRQSIAGALGDDVYELARVYWVGEDGEVEAAKEAMAKIRTEFGLPGN